MDPTALLLFDLDALTAWAPLGAAVLVSIAVPLVYAPLALRGPVRRAQDAEGSHWTLVARERWYALTAASSVSAACFMSGAAVGFSAGAALGWRPMEPGPRLLALLCAVVADSTYAWWRRRLITRLPGPVIAGRHRWAAAWLRQGLMLIGLLGLLIVPASFDSPWTWVVLVAVGGLSVGFIRGGLLVGLRALGVLGPPGERLMALDRRRREELGTPPLRLHEVDHPTPNALALFWRGDILVFRGALEALDDEQLLAVLAHEARHADERGAQRLALMVQGVVVPLLLASLPPIGGTFGPFAMVGGIVAFPLMGRIAFRLLAGMEKRADGAGAHEEVNPGVYARALEAVHRGGLIPATLPPRVDPHGDLYDRMKATGVEPDFERPSPPPAPRLIRTVSLVITVAIWVLSATLAGLNRAGG